MPVYVRSSAGGANSGADWANAFTSIVSAFTVAAGDTVWVANDHVETVTAGASLTLNFSNSLTNNRVRVISVLPNADTDAWRAHRRIGQ